MNATDAINKIVDLLGIKFSAHKFASTKLVDGETEVTNNKESVFQVGDELFIVSESILTPAPEGTHTTREGLELWVGADSVIYKIMEKEMQDSATEDAEIQIEIETKDGVMKEQKMTRATLADGTEIETDEDGKFEVGQKLYVMKDGERVSAPEGEHTTDSGITLTVDAEGVITGVKYPDETGEGSLEDMKKEMDKMKEAMSEMVGLFNQMKNFNEEFKKVKSDFEQFKKQPDRSPVVKNIQKENILDLKLELLKNSYKK